MENAIWIWDCNAVKAITVVNAVNCICSAYCLWSLQEINYTALQKIPISKIFHKIYEILELCLIEFLSEKGQTDRQKWKKKNATSLNL